MKNVSLLTHVDFYKTFFDHGWARGLHARVPGTKLSDPVFNLCVNWKAAANSHLMPWLMVESLKKFWEGYVSSQESWASLAIWHLVREVPAAMASHLTNMNRKKLAEVMAGVGDRWKRAQVREAEKVNSQEVFEQFLLGDGGSELQLAIWGTQRTVYEALFHAYEDFVTQCVGLARSEPEYRPFAFKTLISDAKSAFGDEVAAFCLEHPFVEASRLARNALAHRGGRVDEKLMALDHGIEVVGGELQIRPNDNVRLLNELKARVDKVVEAAVALPG